MRTSAGITFHFLTRDFCLHKFAKSTLFAWTTAGNLDFETGFHFSNFVGQALNMERAVVSVLAFAFALRTLFNHVFNLFENLFALVAFGFNHRICEETLSLQFGEHPLGFPILEGAGFLFLVTGKR